VAFFATCRIYGILTRYWCGIYPLHHRHTPRPSRRRRFDLYGEAAHLEAERRQLVEVGELFPVAIADLAAGLMAFPDDAGVAVFEEALVMVQHKNQMPILT